MGCFIIALGLVASASHYTHSVHYSPKNHFISELGLASASEYAYVFNTCLGLGGILLMLFTIGLGIYLRRNSIAKYASFIGVIATLSFSAIGYFTADDWSSHRNAATLFFSGIMISIVLFSYCIWKSKERKLHYVISLLGFIIATIYFVVLLWPKDTLLQSVNHPEQFIRPELWGLTVLEWSYCLMISFWVLAVSIDMIYVLRKSDTTSTSLLMQYIYKV